MNQNDFKTAERGAQYRQSAEPKPFPDVSMREDWRRYYGNGNRENGFTRSSRPDPRDNTGGRNGANSYYQQTTRPVGFRDDRPGAESRNGSLQNDRAAPDDRHTPPDQRPPQKSGLLDSILGSIRLSGRADGDRILLLGLLLLLSGEDCDRLLLLAILYILI